MKSVVRTNQMSFLSVLVLVGVSIFGMRCYAAAPNILFIVSDDHGWGDLPSNWDDTEVHLPTLDALARSGVRFPNYHTVPLCGPSRACMFTGQYSTENGMWRGPGSQPLGSPGYRGIKRDVKMLSEYLSEAGYATGAFGKWHLGSLEGEVPNDRGFDEFHGFLGGAHPYWISGSRSKIMHNRDHDPLAKGHATELFTQWAEDFIRENAGKESPFFCYLAYNAVHGPLRVEKSKPASAPEAWVKKALDRGVSFLRSDYVAILEHMDHNIGQLVSVLDELGVAENTLIVFVSDNGGCTMEEGAAGGRFPGNNGPLRGGKATTYQGGLNVPFLVNWKGKIPQSGLVSDSHVMHCDVFSSLLDAAGLSVPESNGKNPVRGMSLLPHMLSDGKTSVPERAMIFELWGNIGVRRGDYKLWASVGRDYSPDWDALAAEISQKDLELFDLQRDVAETKDLRTEHPEMYASLKAELIDHLSSINADYPLVVLSDVKSKAMPKQQKRSKTIPPKERSPEKFFQARDRNSDGEITLEEFIGNPDGRNVAALTKRFQQFDADGDGALVIDELKSN
ncbi:MAG: sulfatase-like hydrolase/transferase [Pirellulales bacterium]|nr:sulfatase-like hydrolase/transferase [Pirellulales bacterium]